MRFIDYILTVPACAVALVGVIAFATKLPLRAVDERPGDNFTAIMAAFFAIGFIGMLLFLIHQVTRR